MKLTKTQQDETQQMLSGMKAGFTLQKDSLYVRFGNYTLCYYLHEISDLSEICCFSCGTFLGRTPESVKHFGSQTLQIGPHKTTTKIPLCLDCAVPK